MERVSDKHVVALDRQATGRRLRHKFRRLRLNSRSASRLEQFQVDQVGDLFDVQEGGLDLILAASSLEHNALEQIWLCWARTVGLLADQGPLSAIFRIAIDGRTLWVDDSASTLLSLEDAQDVWERRFYGEFRSAIESYQVPYLRERYARRFGPLDRGYPAYIAAGVVKHASARARSSA